MAPFTYELSSRKGGPSTGKIDIDAPLPTGWGDWQLTIDKVLPHAEAQTDFTPVAAENIPAAADLPDGLRVHLEQNGDAIEQWVPRWMAAHHTNFAANAHRLRLENLPLRLGLELLEFGVKRNDGSDTPASFKSTLRFVSSDGATATGSCWMNHPFSFPGRPLNTWTGQTYNISQASWNPENLDQAPFKFCATPAGY